MLAQLQPVGQGPAAQHLADRVRQARHLAQAGGDALDALRVERQPVEHGLGGARGAGGGQVLAVGREDVVDGGQHGVGRGVQGLILDGGGQRGHGARGGPGAARGVVDLCAQVGLGIRKRGCLQIHRPSVSRVSLAGWLG